MANCINLSIVWMINKSNLKINKLELKEFLDEKVNESLSFQEEQLKKLFSNWKGDKEQTDYVTFIAIRI